MNDDIHEYAFVVNQDSPRRLTCHEIRKIRNALESYCDKLVDVVCNPKTYIRSMEQDTPKEGKQSEVIPLGKKNDRRKNAEQTDQTEIP